MSLGKRVGQGYIEETVIDDVAFNMQYQNFQRSGYAMDLNSQKVLGSAEGYYLDHSQNPQKRMKSNSKESKTSALLSSLMEYGSDEEEGPWAKEKKEDTSALPLLPPSTSSKSIKAIEDEPDLPPHMHIIETDEENEKWERKSERKLSYTLPPRPRRGATIPEATSIFHGESEVDFEGRSWMAVPKGVHSNEGEHDCFLPKKCTHKLGGHSKGVQVVEFFPSTGHLLLSAAMDGKCKIWNAHQDFSPLRTYGGHSEGVRSAQFNNKGTHFLSSGFDRVMRLWDVETGQASTFSNRKMGYTVRFSPRDDNVFLMACSDNRIYQWDVRSGEICQEYNYHLAPCNTVCFIDEGRKFISTSDDKKILVWEFDIPVPIKYIQDPTLHSLPYIAHHPKEEYVAMQSMDNTIVVYTGGEKVRAVKKKTYRGHNNSGYACQVNFSPNGRFLTSGDGLGGLFFWEWKTGKMVRKLPAHDNGPTMGVAWHPLHPSRVATCGWDGMVKIWD